MRKTMAYINMDIDLDEIIDGLSSHEKQELVDELYIDGYYQTELEKQIYAGSDYDNVSLNEQLVSYLCKSKLKTSNIHKSL